MLWELPIGSISVLLCPAASCCPSAACALGMTGSARPITHPGGSQKTRKAIAPLNALLPLPASSFTASTGCISLLFPACKLLTSTSKILPQLPNRVSVIPPDLAADSAVLEQELLRFSLIQPHCNLQAFPWEGTTLTQACGLLPVLDRGMALTAALAAAA